MPMALLLCEPNTEPRISPALAGRLAPLGITGVTVLQDATLTGLVLEGWAFDPASASDAVNLLADEGIRTRLLLPTVALAVHAATMEGRSR
jgi:hypothetical protein